MNTIYSWQGGASTDFADAANWFDVVNGVTATSPPGAGDIVQLTGSGTIGGTGSGLALLTVSATSAGGYALGATLDVSAIEVRGALAFTDGASVTADALGIAGGAVDMQSGSTLTAAGQALEISVSGSAAGSAASLLRLDAGATIYTAGGSVQIGVSSGQTGSLLVAGGSLECDLGGQLAVGAEGARGTVDVANGGSIAVYSGVALGVSGQGLLTLDPGGYLDANNFQGGPALVLGTTAVDSSLAGRGTLISLGATITVSSDTLIGDTGQGDLVAGGGTLSTSGVTLGAQAGASGTLALGANESWTDNGIVTVGAAGDGTLQMTAYAAGTGSVTVGSLSVGGAGGSGRVAITHETMNIEGSATLGEGGGQDSITIGAGGVWNGAGQSVLLYPGGTSGSSTLGVSGTGATFDAATLFGFAGSQIAFGAGASARIGSNAATDSFGSAGGTVTIASAALTVGAVMGVRAGGTISISGSASIAASAGLLVLDQSSTVAIGGGVFGVSSASGNAVQVSDGGTLTVSNAALNVTAARGQAAGAAIGSANGSLSLASVTGGAHLSVAGALAIAAQGRGELDISGGGTVTAGPVSVGGIGSAHGSLSLAGSGDALTTSLLSIGAAGTVTLGNGSHLAAGGLLIGTASQGTLAATSGSLAVAGGKLAVFGGASVHGAVVLSQGGTLAVSNGLTLAAGSTIIGQGVLNAGNIVDLGRIGDNGGTMTCLGPVNGTGLLSVANGDVVLAQGEASTVGLVFGTNGTFTAAGVGLLSGVVTGWATGDAFDFTNVHIASDTVSGHVLTLLDAAGHVLGRETFAGSFASTNFSLSADHGAGTLLSFHV